MKHHFYSRTEETSTPKHPYERKHDGFRNATNIRHPIGKTVKNPLMQNLVYIQAEVIFRDQIMIITNILISFVFVMAERLYSEKSEYPRRREEPPILSAEFVQHESEASICVGVFMEVNIFEPYFILTERMVVERLEVHVLVYDSKLDLFRLGPLVYFSFRCTLMLKYKRFMIVLRTP